jgi:hypothetical protein
MDAFQIDISPEKILESDMARDAVAAVEAVYRSE